MVQVNLALKEINCKIVYFGPGLSGKTTNLEVVHQKAPKDAKGELTSIATESDRTLFFDFMPLDLGSVGGMKTKFQLYTVPGQVYYNSTRKLVLRGADGVVFIADSAPDKMEENIESLDNLEECLREQGRSLSDFPHAIQFNKRDLPEIMSIEEMDKVLNRYGAPTNEAVAATGKGVIETFKNLSGLVLDKVKAMAERRSPAGAAPGRPGGAKPSSGAAGSGTSGSRPVVGESSSPGGSGVTPLRGIERNAPPMPAAGSAKAPAAVLDAPRESPASQGSKAGRGSRSASPEAKNSPRSSKRPSTGTASTVGSVSGGSSPSLRTPKPRTGSNGHRVIVTTSRKKQTEINPIVWVALGAAVIGGVAFALTQGLI